MKKMMLTILAFALALPLWASAQENSDSTSSVKAQEVKPDNQKNKVPGDIDEDITNANLRAQSGSKSKWSGSFTALYQGASLETPLGPNRPNITNSPIPDRVQAFGDLGIRYRMNKNDSLSLGTGWSVIQPLQEARYWDIDDPYLALTDARKLKGIQVVSVFQGTGSTNQDEVAVGQVGYATWIEQAMYDFGGSKASVGLTTQVDYTYYSMSPDTQVRLAGQSNFTNAGAYQTPYDFAVYPAFEYAFSEKLNFRTLFRPWIYYHHVGQQASTFTKSPWTQSIGIGWDVTRDIYLYPNFQFVWEDTRGKNFDLSNPLVRAESSVGLSATINMF